MSKANLVLVAVVATLSGCAMNSAATQVRPPKVVGVIAHPAGKHPNVSKATAAVDVPEPLAKAAAKPTAKVRTKSRQTGKSDELVSLNFQNVPVKSVLSVLAMAADRNFVLSPEVTGNTSIHVKDVPWKYAFNALLVSQFLTARDIGGGVYWVGPVSQANAMEKAKLEASATRRSLEPLVTEVIRLNYLRAKTVAALLNNAQAKEKSVSPGSSILIYGQSGASANTNTLLGKRGSVSAISGENSLLVRDTPAGLKEIRSLLETIDKPQPQVLIEAKFVQVNTNAAKSFGVNWGGTYTSRGAGGLVNLSGTQASGSLYQQGGSYTPGASASSSTGASSTSSGGTGIFPVAAFPAMGANPASIGLALGTAAGERVLQLQLQALENSGKAKLVSTPRIVTESNHSATIEQGAEIPYQNATSSGATSTSYQQADLSLKVLPQVTPNGMVQMKLTASNDQPNYAQATAQGVPINTQSVTSQVLLRDNQTLVVGGLITESTNLNKDGVPGLERIPLLGWLFHNWSRGIQKSELLVFITPHIVPTETP
jgi:type IV pilus assembly protein PilQ